LALACALAMAERPVGTARPYIIDSPAINLAQRLGYPADARMVIIHADDAGVTHSVDQAIEAAFSQGAISSSSILVAAPWFPEIAAYAKAHPEHDFGIHTDLTAEWQYLRWQGVLPADQIASLLDEQGFFWRTVAGVAEHVRPEEAERELRAQITRAREFGVPITHLDTHMGAVFATPQLASVYLKLGREYHLPLLLRQVRPDDPPSYQRLRPLVENNPNVLLADIVQFGQAQEPVSNFASEYQKVIESLQPGQLTQIIIHPGINNDELRAAMGDGAYGAEWRQADFSAFTSSALQQLLRNRNVHLVTWKQLGALLR
jgi:predicted glycoside hydrolase/deacetylase ChbG (UPF0249 family)